MPYSIDLFASYTVSPYMYFFPVNPSAEMSLYRAIVAGLIGTAAPPIAHTRMALYRIVQRAQTARTNRTNISSKVSFQFITEFAISYAQIAYPIASYTATTGINSTGTLTQISGTLERAHRLIPSVQYAIAFVGSGQPVVLSAPTTVLDMAGFLSYTAGPGSGPMPVEVSADSFARTPAITLLSPIGSGILSG